MLLMPPFYAEHLHFVRLASLHGDHALPQDPEQMLSWGISEEYEAHTHTVPAQDSLCTEKSEKVE